jgi:short-subunit dehydrogenase
VSKKILLTGHTKGIGNAILNSLLIHNAHVTGIARSQLKNTDNLQQLSYDLSKEDDLKNVCRELKKESFDAIILNAGYNDIRPAESYSVEEILQIITLNFTAHAALIKTCLPNLINNKGHIIAIGSFSGIEVGKWNNYYGAAKAALHHLMQNLFEQYRKQGLKCTTIIPDITNSDFYTHQQFEPAENNDAYIEPAAIAQIVDNLLFDNKNYVTTEIIVRPQRFELKRK